MNIIFYEEGRTMQKKGSSTAIQIILAVVLFLFIISAAVTITLNFRPLYYADIDFLDIPQATGRTVEDIRANYDALIDYNFLFNREPLYFPTCAISETGRIHFAEVKDIFDAFGWMMIITLIVLAAGIIFLRKSGRYLWLKIAGIAGIVVPAVLGLLVAVNWDWVFVTFHNITFDNDYWIFNAATDPIIELLPDEFFMHAAILIFVIIFAASIVSLVIGLILTKRARKKQPANDQKN